MVDTLVVGRFLGMDALAGVGSTSSVNFLVLGFCIGICNGFVIPVAQKFGEGDEAELRRFVANSIWLSAAFAVVLTRGHGAAVHARAALDEHAGQYFPVCLRLHLRHFPRHPRHHPL